MGNASKLALMASVVLVFFGVLLLVFFLAARARGKVQTPLARLIFLGPAALLLLIGLVIPAIQTTYQSFLGPDGKPLPFVTALLSGRSTGVPGAVAMLAQVQKEHGRAAWNTLFRDAETLASDGFVVSPRLAGMINSPRVPQNSAADVKAYFTKPDGTLYQAGDTLRNPAYAATLKRLAAEGPRALYEGPIAQAIVDKHCVTCHSPTPTHKGFRAPPNGATFDTPEHLQKYAGKIRERAVETSSMPLGNETGMTDAERAQLGAWIKQGAKIP